MKTLDDRTGTERRFPLRHPFFEYCNNVPIYPNGVSALGRGSFGSQFWEMANSLFTAASLPHPYSAQVLSQAGYVPEATSADHPGLALSLSKVGALVRPLTVSIG